jgi:hypothetical protein
MNTEYRAVKMKRLASILSLFGTLFLVAGCSLVSDFGDYEFNGGQAGEDGGPGGQGGASVAGQGGEPSAGTGGGPVAGSGGTGGTGGGGSGGTEEDAGIDAEVPDGEVDAGPDASDAGTDAFVPECDDDNPCDDGWVCDTFVCVPERATSGVFLSSGGGYTVSTSYTIRVSVGMPQPMGVVQGRKFTVTVGPGSGRP